MLQRLQQQPQHQPITIQHPLHNPLQILLGLVLLDNRLRIGQLVARFRLPLGGTSPNTLLCVAGMCLQGTQSLEQRGGFLGLVAAFAGFVSHADPAFLDTDVGERGVEAGEFDGSVVAFCAGGDGVEDGELDDFADEEFAEEFTGVEAVWLALIELAIIHKTNLSG